MSKRSDRLVRDVRPFGLTRPGAHSKAPRKLVRELDSRGD